MLTRRKFRQLLDEYKVDFTTFAKVSGIPWFSMWFSLNVYPLPSVSAALYHYTFMLAALELALRRSPIMQQERWAYDVDNLNSELTQLSRVIASETVTKILAGQELEPMEIVTERFNSVMGKYWAGEENG